MIWPAIFQKDALIGIILQPIVVKPKSIRRDHQRSRLLLGQLYYAVVVIVVRKKIAEFRQEMGVTMVLVVAFV